MARKRLTTRIQILRKHTDYWNKTENILRVGEIGYDVDRKIFKIGDGVSLWKNLRVSFSPFKELGFTIIDGGSPEEVGPDRISVTVAFMTEESPRYSNGEYIPLKGEPIALKTDANQYMKIGDGKQTVTKLPFVTPPDDVSVSNIYGECEDFKK